MRAEYGRSNRWPVNMRGIAVSPANSRTAQAIDFPGVLTDEADSSRPIRIAFHAETGQRRPSALHVPPKAPYVLVGLYAKYFSDFDEFKYLQLPLARFKLSHERIRALETCSKTRCVRRALLRASTTVPIKRGASHFAGAFQDLPGCLHITPLGRYG